MRAQQESDIIGKAPIKKQAPLFTAVETEESLPSCSERIRVDTCEAVAESGKFRASSVRETLAELKEPGCIAYVPPISLLSTSTASTHIEADYAVERAPA